MEDVKGKGLMERYTLTKVSGEPIHPEAKYFVLRFDDKGSDPVHTAACRKALRMYAHQIKDHLPELSKDLLREVDKYDQIVNGGRELVQCECGKEVSVDMAFMDGDGLWNCPDCVKEGRED